MKKIVLLATVILVCCQVSVLAQNNTMGIGTSSPNANAVLHVEAPNGNQGFIMPRLTTAQRTASGFTSVLTSGDNGLMVYDTTLKSIYIWDGASWVSVTQAAGGPQLVYPYADSVTSLPDSAVVFKIKYDGGVTAGVHVVRFENTNMQNSGVVLQVSTTGTGHAGIFAIKNASNGGSAVVAQTSGTGTALVANQAGTLGDIAIFAAGGSHQARIDRTGKGFFNGGTVTSGADVAELFAVEGEPVGYTPGDVLVISERSDRTVEKCDTPNSTRVAGVYATKPGVLLTETNIEENVDGLVPMGVVGVIPTKVCLENGPVKRGDLMVTSSRPGHAMKAIPVVVNGVELYPTGAIIGKALENFDGQETGMIRILVNVK